MDLLIKGLIMNKIFDLCNFLKLSGFNKEFEILKTALETTPEELKEAFPQLFRFYEEGKPTAMFGGVFAQINKYIEEGYVTQQEIDAIQNFESLKQKMKELKTLKKETEARFKYLNEYDIGQEFKELAKQKKLSKEDFEFAHKSFIAEDEDNHQLDQAIVEISDLREKYRLLKEKINTIEDNEDLLSRLADPLAYKTLDNANTEINNLMMDVANIIEGRQAGGLKKKLLNYYDYIYNGENKLNAGYPEGRRGAAKETSKVLYNDGDWVIVNSWSEEACQYWERGAVRVEGDKVRFNTCTSRIRGVHGLTYENMYNSYSKYTVFQILKLENGQPKFYEGPNEMLTLCFDFKDSNFKMVQGASASVNADDKNMTNEMVKETLPENIYAELQSILNSDKKYELLSLKQLLDSKVPDEIRSELIYEKVKKASSEDFFSIFNKIPISIADEFLEEKILKIKYNHHFWMLIDRHFIDKPEGKMIVQRYFEEKDLVSFSYKNYAYEYDSFFGNGSYLNELGLKLKSETTASLKRHSASKLLRVFGEILAQIEDFIPSLEDTDDFDLKNLDSVNIKKLESVTMKKLTSAYEKGYKDLNSEWSAEILNLFQRYDDVFEKYYGEDIFNIIVRQNKSIAKKQLSIYKDKKSSKYTKRVFEHYVFEALTLEEKFNLLKDDIRMSFLDSFIISRPFNLELQRRLTRYHLKDKTAKYILSDYGLYPDMGYDHQSFSDQFQAVLNEILKEKYENMSPKDFFNFVTDDDLVIDDEYIDSREDLVLLFYNGIDKEEVFALVDNKFENLPDSNLKEKARSLIDDKTNKKARSKEISNLLKKYS